MKSALLMEQHIFSLSLIIEDATEKVLQFKMQQSPVSWETFDLKNKKSIFEYCRKVNTINSLYNFILFV